MTFSTLNENSRLISTSMASSVMGLIGASLVGLALSSSSLIVLKQDKVDSQPRPLGNFISLSKQPHILTLEGWLMRR